MNKPTGHGFTTIEVMVAVIIITVVSSITIDVAFRARQRELVNGFAINLQGWIDKVRTSSLRGSGCSITINSGELSQGATIATSSKYSGSSPIDQEYICSANNPLLMTDVNSIDSQSKFEIIPDKKPSDEDETVSPETTIIFTPRGTLHLPSGGINLTVKLSSGPSRCVSIIGMMAEITISKTCSVSSVNFQEKF